MNSRQMTTFAAVFGTALLVASLFARPAFADEPLVGTWKAVSFVVEDLETKEQKAIFGQHPAGLAIFTPQKGFFSFMTAEGRKGGESEAERAQSFNSMVAFAGTYRVEGSKYFVKLEVSQFPALVHMELARDFKIEGNRLTVTTAPEKSRLMNGHMSQSVVVWERVTQ